MCDEKPDPAVRSRTSGISESACTTKHRRTSTNSGLPVYGNNSSAVDVVGICNLFVNTFCLLQLKHKRYVAVKEVCKFDDDLAAEHKAQQNVLDTDNGRTYEWKDDEHKEDDSAKAHALNLHHNFLDRLWCKCV